MQFILYLVICFGISCSSISPTQDGGKLIGTKAPDWSVDHWLQSPPLQISDLRGKVVLIRWWVEECSYCIATAPSLNTFHQQYVDEGLIVIGMYHPKPYPRDIPPNEVLSFVKDKGFDFPIALDNHWTTLKRYWLDSGNRSFTSVSFLIDKEGVIRHIHPGGEYHLEGAGEHEKCSDDYRKMEESIKQLLAS